MKNPISFYLLFLTLPSLAQTGDIYIGERRNSVQTKLGKLEISEYEKSHVGYLQEDSLWLYVFFNDDNFCTKHYWLSTASSKLDIIAHFKQLNWLSVNDDKFVKDVFTMEIKPINKGNNFIYLVEKSPEIVESDIVQVKEKTKEKPVVEMAKPTPTLIAKKSNLNVEETKAFQGLTFLAGK